MRIRDFEKVDTESVNRVALAAFEQFKTQYDDWPAMAEAVGTMSRLAEAGDVIVAERAGRVIGAVAYIPPNRPKAAYFDAVWPVIRMLVVDPQHRGAGAGRALTQACIDRAEQDGSGVIALHTSPIMTVALPLYLRMGFELICDAPPIYGVPYSVYLKALP